MTKKDYQRLATALYLAKPDPVALPGDSPDIVEQWRVDVDRIADALAEDNPRFSRETFITACETGDVSRRPKRKPLADAMKAHDEAAAVETHHGSLWGLPLCVRAMRCYCAGHARGNAASEPCDTREEA